MPPNNPENERLKLRYFNFETEAKGKSPKTIEGIQKALIRFEEFTGFQSFKTFTHKQATDFKAYLLTSKNKYGKPLSPSTIAHTLAPLKEFMRWLAMQPSYKSCIKFSDMEYLNLSEKDKRGLQPNTLKQYPSPEQIRKAISTLDTKNEVGRRNQAIMATTFATGIRDGALIGLKLKHVNIARKYVVQDPKEVATKFGKRIDSMFYPIGDDIHQIVIDWVKFLREQKLFSDSDPLFPKEMLVQDAEMTFKGGQLLREHWQSATAVRGVFKQAFEAAGLPYYSPHRFRDTLSAIGREMCISTDDQMAWARNMGHESPATTFLVYGGFSTNHQFEVIERLGKKDKKTELSNVEAIAEAVARRMGGGNIAPIQSLTR
jgi:integrase